jgi:hypothetical protein
MVAAEVALATMGSRPVRTSAGKTRKVPPPARALAMPPISAVDSSKTNCEMEMSGRDLIVAAVGWRGE